ncbi:MAG: D-alanyl-D-alanine carboxypeptidase [Bacilli bacterium]|nr:D-alanyl-D-alanine carboxypeptidase [Bacilli bacterium]
MKKLKYLLLLILLLPISVFALDDIDLYSKAYIIYDSTDDRVLIKKDNDKQNYIASTTKMMSILVALDSIDNLDTKVTIEQSWLNTVPWDAYKMGLKAGDEVTYKDLLYGTMLPSAADAVNSLAMATNGSISTFVKKMNDKATEIGMKNTNFTNPIGMDDNSDINHHSTADDLLVLVKYALKDDRFKEVYETKEYTLTNGFKAVASSKSFGDQKGINTDRIIGAKTGFTDKAGFCLAYEFKAHDHTYYAVTLGAPVENFRDFKHLRDANTVIDYIEKNYEYKTLFKKDDVYKAIQVNDSTIDYYDVKYKDDLTLLLPIDFKMEDLRIENDLLYDISYKFKKGDKLGTVKMYYQDELIYSEDFYLEETIKPSIIGFIKNNVILCSIMVVAFTILVISLMILIKRKTKKIGK